MILAFAALPLIQPGFRLFLLLGIYGGLLVGGLLAGVAVLMQLARHPPDWSARVRELTTRPLNDRFILVYTAGVLVLWVAGAGFSVAVLRQGSWAWHESAGPLIHGVFFHGLGLLGLAGYIRRRGLSWGRAFGIGSESFVCHAGRAIILYLAVMPVVITVGLVFSLFLWWFGYPLEFQDVVNLFRRGLPQPALGAMIMMVLVMAPVFEELLFRGLGLPLLTRRLGLAPAIVLTSFLFAVAHLHLMSFPQLFVLAAAFSLAYVATGSLLIPILMHALFNGVNLGLLWLVTAE